MPETALTRRGLVAVAPAAMIAATMPAYAGAHPDAALLALREPYERTLAIMDQVSPAHERAEAAYFALKTEQPELDERALREASGLIPAERAWDRATNANLAVIDRIAAQPARTIAGVFFKAEISDREGNAEPDLMESIVADLIAMGGANA